ncbi:Fe-S cluster assembly sulfur transfer protein SufU [Streptococcus hyovaginalis]|uniref:Fe-S cluster assembly sulfur transfer protein SufU n=1 Tax=Streptococcus hyovaginalis TaxID=149015 RepID=UPI003ADA45DA
MGLSKLQNLYMAVVTEHSKAPHHYGKVEGKTISLHNPTCGDVIFLSLKYDEDVISDIAFEGHGCSISVASSSMMTDLVLHKTKQEALELAHIFSEMVQGQQDDRQKALGDAAFLAGVSKFPQRIKCATLSWNALTEVLSEE